jgi:hypothetical protein
MARLRELAMHFGIAATEESPPAPAGPSGQGNTAESGHFNQPRRERTAVSG